MRYQRNRCDNFDLKKKNFKVDNTIFSTTLDTAKFCIGFYSVI